MNYIEQNFPGQWELINEYGKQDSNFENLCRQIALLNDTGTVNLLYLIFHYDFPVQKILLIQY